MVIILSLGVEFDIFRRLRFGRYKPFLRVILLNDHQIAPITVAADIAMVLRDRRMATRIKRR